MHKSLALGLAAVAFSALPALACTPITSQTVALTGCVDEQWQPLKGTGAQEFSYQTADGRYALMVITEKVAVPLDQFKDAIVANAITGAGGKKEDVTVGESRTEVIDGKTFNVLEYTLANNGQPIEFQNYYYSDPNFGSLQVLAYSLVPDSAAAGFKGGLFAATLKLGQ